jgi:predicted glycosyltransferase/ActR/RegA family two-component response regulator
MNDKPFALIVDDEWRLAQNLMRYMQRKGFEAKAVTSVTDANVVITERRPDIALIDLKLPDFNGIELCRMLNARYPQTPLLVMSARVDEDDRQALHAVGVRGFLTKPFALRELADQLATLDQGLPSMHPPARPPDSTRPAWLPTHQPAPTRRRPGPRIVLYSHDTMGLGHMRRNILIARSLAESRIKANVLLVSGAREIGRFELPAGIDCLVLPSYRKSAAGNYESRHLDLETQELVSLRAQTINASVLAFDPDVFVVDNVPRGALNELDNVLSSLNARNRTRLVLGLRDILDAPQATRAEWAKRNNLNTIQWHYDEVWIYGDPKIYNPCETYGFGDAFNRKVRFTGYLDARKRATPRASDIVSPTGSDEVPNDKPYNLCLVGGGQDGFALAEAFALSCQPAMTLGVLITGPFMQPEQIERLHQIAEHRDDLEVLGFVEEPTDLLSNARRVVAMGGYNTVNEVLAFNRPTLIVPRIRPRQEQIVRAQRLAELGYIDMLHPDALQPAAIGEWLDKPDAALPGASAPIDLLGLKRLADYVARLTNEKGIHHATA